MRDLMISLKNFVAISVLFDHFAVTFTLMICFRWVLPLMAVEVLISTYLSTTHLTLGKLRSILFKGGEIILIQIISMGTMLCGLPSIHKYKA